MNIETNQGSKVAQNSFEIHVHSNHEGH